MTRFAFTITLAIVFTAWADAQSGGPIASDHARQYQANRALLSNLIDHTVELAAAGEPLSKAQACHHLMTDLSNAMGVAVTDQNPARVAELGDHLAAVVSTALVPSIQSAGVTITPESEQYRTLRDLHTQAKSDMQRVSLSVPMFGTLGNSASVKDALTRMKSAETTLNAALTK